MSILVSAHQLTKAFGARPLFTNLTFSIESHDRIGLVGPNGAGKSTLLRILALQEPIDSGTLSFQKGIQVGFLEQVPYFEPNATLFSAVMSGKTSQAEEDWEQVAWVQEILSRLSLTESDGFPPSTPIDKLSGGWKKRVALARELVRKPNLLLLDEPTNHLDLESIIWLEEFLSDARFATLTITHDRAFLQNISNRIIELDRRHPAGLLSVNGDYSKFIELKTQTLSEQQQREVVLKNTLRRETEWLRRGAKARTTKQQARIQRAEDLKDEVSQIEARNRNRSVRVDFQASEKNPKKLLEAKGISKSFDSKLLFDRFDLILNPGSRVGILGRNGAGKSTLIRILLGEEQPSEGEVFRSDFLKVAYFEQNRDTLDPNETLLKTLCPTGDQVIFQGKSVHIRSYLDRFLFDTAQMTMPIGRLSGGEQARVLIARLMLQEANLLVLDEPTNDLDFPTLNILEQCLTEFQGAILLVTHDRYFLDQIANQILAFPHETAKSRTIERFEGLSQWTQWTQLHSATPINSSVSTPVSPTPSSSSTLPAPKKKKGLSFKEQREWEQIENAILQAEAEVAQLTEESIKPENSNHHKRLTEILASLDQAQQKVDHLYERWSILSALKE